ncbi:MAG: hypothetical protein GY874_06630 [Desulfobacteraceae bacterium]|nr:hypothetical protein [Desulfobacteraceae bacterium]
MQRFCAMTYFALLGFVFLCSCAYTVPQVPEGFAQYEKVKDIKAISPDGVMYRVRVEDNKPYAELSFWKEAYKNRMIETGYTFLRESDIKTKKVLKGYLLELTAPVGLQDYTYLTVVFVRDKELIIVEAAGEVLKLKDRRDAIIKAIRNLAY